MVKNEEFRKYLYQRKAQILHVPRITAKPFWRRLLVLFSVLLTYGQIHAQLLFSRSENLCLPSNWILTLVTLSLGSESRCGCPSQASSINFSHKTQRQCVNLCLGKLGQAQVGNFIGAEGRIEFMTVLQAKPPEPTGREVPSLPAPAVAPWWSTKVAQSVRVLLVRSSLYCSPFQGPTVSAPCSSISTLLGSEMLPCCQCAPLGGLPVVSAVWKEQWQTFSCPYSLNSTMYQLM